MLSSVDILGVKINRVTKNQVLSLLDRFVTDGKRRHFVTVNPEYLVEASQRKSFKKILNQADLALADGVGITLAGKLKGKPFPARITGVGLVEEICRQGAKKGWRVFLLGGAPGVAGRAAYNLEQRWPSLNVGYFSGAKNIKNESDEEKKEAMGKINQFDPDVLLVAYGAPWQDMWVRENFFDLKFRVAMGVGGTFDYLAGEKKRAPRVFRRVGLEWLWRVVKEPKRLPRILRATVIFPFLFVRSLRFLKNDE